MDTITMTKAASKIDEIEKDMAGKELGEEIKRLRLKAGWSQEELAHRIGLHQTRAGRLENGEHNYPLETIYRLASAFKISPFELAAIYWGITPVELPNRDRELLNNLLSLFDEYRAEVPKTSQANTQAYKGIKEASAVSKRRSRAAAKKEAPASEVVPEDNPQ